MKGTSEVSEEFAIVFGATAEVLEKEGWVQGCLRNRNGYCLDGALQKALGLKISYHTYNDNVNLFRLRLAQYLPLPLMPPRGSLTPMNAVYHVTDYNDTPGRTAQEVIDRLREIEKKELE